MATNSSYRKLGYLGFLGFLGFFGLVRPAELLSLFSLFGLFTLFITRTETFDSRKEPPSRGAIIVATGITALVLTIVLAHYGFSLRTVREAVLVPQMDVNIYAKHVDEIAVASDVITKLEVDRRTNTIIVSAQARNLDAAVEEVNELIRDPSPVLAASSLNVSVNDVRELLALANGQQSVP